MFRNLRCLAQKQDGIWEAYCLDLDIAVHGQSFPEVYDSLRQAVREYCLTVSELDTSEKNKLAPRRAPLSLWLKFYAVAVLDIFLGSSGKDERRHGFIVPETACTA